MSDATIHTETSPAPHVEIHPRSFLSKLLRPTRAERRRMLRLEAWILVITAYLAVLFAYLLPQDFRNQSPAYVIAAWTAFMVRTFIFHLGLVILVVAGIAAWTRTWRLSIAALPLVVFTLGPSVWQYRPRSVPPTAGDVLTVMSVNLLMVNEDTQLIIDEIKTARPDVLLLQEYTEHWHEALQAAIGRDYRYTAYEAREDSFGVAIYSRYHFLEPVRLDLRLGVSGLPQVRAVIAVDGRPVAFYNIHVLPPSNLESVIETRVQLADLLEILADEPLPVVLAGDFNFPEVSPQAGALRRLGFRDAHDLAGWGRGSTWPVISFYRFVPGIRLDHIYLSEELTATACSTGTGQGSDHRPVVAKIGIAR